MEKVAIVFITEKISQPLLDFAVRMSENKPSDKYDICIVADKYEGIQDEAYGVVYKKNVTLVYIPDEVCISSGICNSNISADATHIKKNPIAFDKALYHLINKNVKYTHFWIIEDDVYMNKHDTVFKLHEKYKEYDLVVPNNFLKEDNLLDWHWRHIFDKIEPPYYYSMMCAFGGSSKLLDEINKYVQKHNSLFYLEVMCNTLAMHAGLKVIDAKELKSIVWMGQWGVNEFYHFPNNLFHPVKDIENHDKYRADVEDMEESHVIMNMNFPSFLIK